MTVRAVTWPYIKVMMKRGYVWQNLVVNRKSLSAIVIYSANMDGLTSFQRVTGLFTCRKGLGFAESASLKNELLEL